MDTCNTWNFHVDTCTTWIRSRGHLSQTDSLAHASKLGLDASPLAARRRTCVHLRARFGTGLRAREGFPRVAVGERECAAAGAARAAAARRLRCRSPAAAAGGGGSGGDSRGAAASTR